MTDRDAILRRIEELRPALQRYEAAKAEFFGALAGFAAWQSWMATETESAEFWSHPDVVEVDARAEGWYGEGDRD